MACFQQGECLASICRHLSVCVAVMYECQCETEAVPVVVVVGVHEFFIDTKTYYSVATDVWSGKPLHSFTRKELETYRQVNIVFVCLNDNYYCYYYTHLTASFPRQPGYASTRKMKPV